ncbi:hypothetical protein DEO72_LG3g748 [Vigna unguiculata]|uniref:Uncharacterized protein n=1 Tax=Vigna unguiculata TaxID=3917 RepID=A0A4D6LCE8_VIGUN|nr:hypothetical protein DEO72_LG3g748 [Vigna unguiculata]
MRNQKQRREPLAGGEAAGDSELRTVEYGHVMLADPVAVWLARWWRITGAMTAISRVGGEARKETIRGVGFSPATLPLVAGVDGGVPRRPWDLRQRQGLLESWWLEANGERVSRIEKKKGRVAGELRSASSPAFPTRRRGGAEVRAAR